MHKISRARDAEKSLRRNRDAVKLNQAADFCAAILHTEVQVRSNLKVVESAESVASTPTLVAHFGRRTCRLNRGEAGPDGNLR
jgi:hypothetical protein